jgi:inner membrane protein
VASLLTHGVFAVALGQAAGQSARRDWRFWAAAVLCSILPDADVIGFRIGIHYGALWGHRGMTHSLLFAAITGLVVGVLLGHLPRERCGLALLFFFITASHGVLDAMTDGGLGVAFFSPFDVSRYFLPWRPMHASPIGAHAFFFSHGIRVLWSEIRSVWAPALLIGGFLWVLRPRYRSAERIAPEGPSR